jgi:hypothetical protein
MKRDCGDLDIQKKQTMVDMLLKQVSYLHLNVSKVGEKEILMLLISD